MAVQTFIHDEGRTGAKHLPPQSPASWASSRRPASCVPELPGCMAHGDTQEAALRHVNQAMELWIDTAKEFGDPIPKPKGERLMLA